MRTGEGVRVYANDDVSHRNKRCCPSTVGVVGWCGCRLSVRLSPSDDLETSSFISRNGTSIRQRSHIMLLSSLLSAPLSPLISSSPVLFSHTVLPSHCLSSSGLSSFSNSLIASDDAVPYPMWSTCTVAALGFSNRGTERSRNSTGSQLVASFAETESA